MALPISRDITLAPGVEIPSTLANNLQDMIIGGRHGAIRRVTPAAAGIYTDGSGTTLSLGQVQVLAGQDLAIPLMLAVGESVNDCFVTSRPAGAGNSFNAQLRSSGILISGTLATNSAVAWHREALTLNSVPSIVQLSNDLPPTADSYAVFLVAQVGQVDTAGIDYEVTF